MRNICYNLALIALLGHVLPAIATEGTPNQNQQKKRIAMLSAEICRWPFNGVSVTLENESSEEIEYYDGPWRGLYEKRLGGLAGCIKNHVQRNSVFSFIEACKSCLALKKLAQETYKYVYGGALENKRIDIYDNGSIKGYGFYRTEGFEQGPDFEDKQNLKVPKDFEAMGQAYLRSYFAHKIKKSENPK